MQHVHAMDTALHRRNTVLANSQYIYMYCVSQIDCSGEHMWRLGILGRIIESRGAATTTV